MIVWDAKVDRILREKDRESLPVLSGDGDGFGGDAPAMVAQRMGIQGSLVDVIIAQMNVFVVEVADSLAPSPDGYQWVYGDVAASTEDFAPARNWLRHRHLPTRPWFSPGWYDEMASYTSDAVESLGGSITGRPYQRRHWPVSSVVQVRSSLGNLYVKTVPETDTYEPDLVAVLRPTGVQHLPPAPVAQDRDRRRWMSKEYPGDDGASLTEAQRSPSVLALAELQRASLDVTEELESVGLARRHPRDLAAMVPALMDRDDLWSAQPKSYECWRGLTDAQRRGWKGLGPWLIDCCGALGAFVDRGDVPLTITHGDFHPGNTVHREGGVLIHDWATAEIAHPFMDLGSWIDDMSETGARSDLGSYRGAWRDLADPAELAAIWRVAKPVSGLVALDRAVRMTEEFGELHSGAMTAVVYGWVRRIVGAASDPQARNAHWPTVPTRP